MKSVAIYTVHKAASTFLYRVLYDVCKVNNIYLYSPNDKSNPGWITDSNDITAYAFLKEPIHNQFFVGPLRRPYRLPEGKSFKKIIHVRDPRDGLVSMYHSFSKTHHGISPVELKRRQKMGIEKFILERMDDYLNRYETYQSWIESDREITVLRYEEMLLDFSSWLKEFIQGCGFSKTSLFETIYHKHLPDLNPAGAKEGTHKRKMIPGQYKSLDEDIVKTLNNKFYQALQFYGYPTL